MTDLFPAVSPPALEAALRDFFGHSSFREGQRDAIENVLSGEDLLAVFPTGAGKSLLFQLPAFLLPGVTIAVSPLISLMKDQLAKLSARGLAAAVVNSSMSADEQDAAMESVARGETKLLYVAPERFRNARFVRAIERARVSLLAVDEAHCVSEWGHDFRPDYLRLGEAARSLGRPPILAVTATATEKVRKDIAASLGLRAGHRVLVRGFDRPNLRFSVVAASGEREKAFAVEQAIAATNGEGSVIVYCATRKSCERLAARLAPMRGPRGTSRPVVYHAGLAADSRRTVQEKWSSGRVRTVVATNAFGLGIDKEDVRLVVHHDLPGSLEAYYQEAGRAGRDGRDASCVLVFSGADVHLQSYLAQGSFPERECVEAVFRALRERGEPADASSLRHDLPSREWSERAVASSLRLLADSGDVEGDESAGWGDSLYVAIRSRGAASARSARELGVDWERLERLREHEREKLAVVLGYARGVSCRRGTILRYFGAAQDGAAGGCGVCDRCTAPAGDALDAAAAQVVVKKVLSLAVRLRGRFGRGVFARLLAGALDAEDRTRGLAAIPTVGALAPWDKTACAAAVDACLAHELLETRTDDGKYPKLAVTRLGVDALFDRIEVQVAIAKPREVSGRENGRARARPRARAREAEPTTELDAEGERLLESLRAWRKERARETGLPAYCIFHDETLTAIASARPLDLVALMEIGGVGPKKSEKYGEGVLALVRSASKAKGARLDRRETESQK